MKKQVKKIIAITLTLALAIVGTTFSTSSVDAKQAHDCVINQDTTDGMWTYYVVQNEWGNEAASYNDASKVDGFIYSHDVYGWDGAWFHSSDLRSMYNLEAGKNYKCTITVQPLCTEGQTNVHVWTTGGETNIENTNQMGDVTTPLTWTGSVGVTDEDLCMHIGYGNNDKGESVGAYVGGFKIVSVVFEESTETTTADSNTCVIGKETKAGAWTYTVVQNEWNNEKASFNDSSKIVGFQYNHEVYGWDGAWWQTSDIKDRFGLTEGNEYDCTITIKPLCKDDATNIHVWTDGGEVNLDNTDQEGTEAKNLTWSGKVKVGSADLILGIGYGNKADGTSSGAYVGGFEIVSVEFNGGGEVSTTPGESTTAAPESSTVAPESSTATPGTTVAPESTTATPGTTVAPESTTATPGTTEAPVVTTKTPVTTKAPVKAPGKTKVSKATKKKSAKKVKVTLKKVKGAKGYQIAISKKKSSKTIVKKYVTKTKVTISSKKVKKAKKLYVRARAYVMDGTKKKFGAWSKYKKVKITK